MAERVVERVDFDKAQKALDEVRVALLDNLQGIPKGVRWVNERVMLLAETIGAAKGMAEALEIHFPR